MSHIKLTILGTTAGVPTRERAHSAVHLSYDDGKESCFLFDCGEGTQRQFILAGLNMMKIDNIFITHWHGDHCLGLPGMVDTMGFEGRERPLTVYAPEAGKVRKCLGFSYCKGKFNVLSRNVPHRGVRITRLLETDRVHIVSVPVRHGVPAVAYALVEKDKAVVDLEKAASFGLPEKGEIYKQIKETGELFLEGKRILLEDISVIKKGKKIVYSGDTEICGSLRELVHGADILIQDCTYFSEMSAKRPYKHASLPEVIEMFKSEDVKRMVLTHISRKHQDNSQLRSLIESCEGVELAEDFMVVEA